MSDVTEALSLFVYYRVAAADQALAKGAIESMQQRLRDEYPGLQARLMRRADGQAGAPQATWMEVYEHPPQGVTPGCQNRLHELVSALPLALIGARHVETFCDLSAAPAGAIDSQQ
ncbi:MAG: DUF4936 family protein [Burkholderiales bacterium]|jgi:hypothetical protein|nr:MAG: DUF4936 family protein [Burkholderiales bacterium]